jgi:FKBP-type peptidyl-prolyl cis-trans isomerase (trigger factor)
MNDTNDTKKSSQKSSQKNDPTQYSRSDPSPTRVELTFTVPGDEYGKQYQKELGELGKEVRIKGFRPGNAPAKKVEEAHGSEARQRALEKLINDRTTDALIKEEVSPVMSPSVEVADITEDDEVTFIVRVPVIPEVKLADMSKIDVEKDVVSVEDSEVDEVLKRIWQDHRGDHKDRSDKWVQEIAPKLGFQVKTLEDLREQIKEAIRVEKERIAGETYAQNALKQGIEKSKIQVPAELIEYEAHQREHAFLDRLEQMKITKEEFCEQQGVTMEELEEQWKKDSKEAVETDVFLATYARERDVTVTPEDLEAEVELLRQQAEDPDNDLFDNDQWRGYIERVMLKRKAYSAFLSEVRDSGKPSGSPSEKKSKQGS